ncbi:hypothetical protein KVT40_004892 [Elsinoe batatas]|uniref:Uncharacterized protein n=1 Tax=Elsinoe batatas TaxID=2601811 RepID=A0A8K0L0G4_9PEZI|nr:hypothetical protein KVT40_004892 [Elsinoe batatas]
MSSNRPFLSNFLAAFRAHSSTLPKSNPSLSSTSTSTPAVWTAAASTYTGPTQTTQPQQIHSSPRTIDPRKVAAQTSRSTSPGPLPFSPPLQHNVGPLSHATRGTSPSASSAEKSPFPQSTERRTGASSAAIGIPSSANRRRGSDSSSEGGFRDVASGQEKWYIGGRTAGGEERYYKLSVVRRERSADRLSADRLSL